MNKNNKIIVAVIVLIVIIGAGIIIFKPTKSSAPSSPNNSGSNTTNSSASNNTPAAVTITFNGSSFSLSASTIKAGQTIKVVNDSSEPLDFNSDPHPVHTDNPQLNLGAIGSGDSKTATLTTKGHWGFHNHLNSSQHGNITVE